MVITITYTSGRVKVVHADNYSRLDSRTVRIAVQGLTSTFLVSMRNVEDMEIRE